MTDITFDDTQQTAVDNCIDTTQRIVPIYGGAGTGKTTIIKYVYNFLVAKGYSVVLCAPTGKAAKRIKEATGIEAVTMHRLLEYSMPGDVDKETGKALVPGEPKRCRSNPIEYDIVLADEYMMVNHELHRNLIFALPSGGMVRMFGDTNQLSPIEQSKALKDKDTPFQAAIKKFTGVHLTTIHRQSEDSNIIVNGAKIIKGQMPSRTEDFALTVTSEPVGIIEDIVMDGINDDNGIDYSLITNQIISPTTKGWIGTTALNGTIQSLLHPMNKPSFEIARHQWDDNKSLRLYVDDKVIITKNNYEYMVFNGETGKIVELDDIGQVVIDLGDRTVVIPPIQLIEGKNGVYEYNPQKDIDLAYVITTHKSQGSEYDNVVYVMNSSRGFNLNRRNFYTGISRAKRSVRVVTDQKALQYSLIRAKEQVFKSTGAR